MLKRGGVTDFLQTFENFNTKVSYNNQSSYFLQPLLQKNGWEGGEWCIRKGR
jgi:hypothetical protein